MGRCGERHQGQVLLDAQGKPALTRYHSSSGGRTLANEVVYPSDGARPYLRAIDDPYDKVSPLYRWDVSFKRADLQKILHDGIGLTGELTNITADEASRELTITTRGGELKMSTVRFRREISEQAPKSFPLLYPAARKDGEPMPFTLASSRFSIEKTANGFIVHGRGYGHGVGMSQWGAMGRATEGHTLRRDPRGVLRRVASAAVARSADRPGRDRSRRRQRAGVRQRRVRRRDERTVARGSDARGLGDGDVR